MDWTWGWAAVGAIATCVLAVGIVFAIWQIIVTRDNARKSTNAQLAVELFRELRSDKTIEKLRSIYKLKSSEFQCLTDDKRCEIDYVLGKLELIGALVAAKIVNEKLAIEPYGGPAALRCWYILQEYIKKVRIDRGYFSENYEGFARLCLNHFHKSGIKIKLQREGEDDKELVFVELMKPELSHELFRKSKAIGRNEVGN